MQERAEGTLQKENKHLREEVERLHSIIRLLKKDKFGSKSEKYEDISSDQLIFDEIEVEAPNAPAEVEKISYVRKKKGRQKKKPIPADVPREEVVIDLPESEKVCPHDGTQLKQIGEVINEKLKTVPAQTSVIIYRRLKYGKSSTYPTFQFLKLLLT